MYPAQSVTVEYTALFTKHLIYADISKTCFGREREGYVSLQGIVNIFYIKNMFATGLFIIFKN